MHERERRLFRPSAVRVGSNASMRRLREALKLFLLACVLLACSRGGCSKPNVHVKMGQLPVDALDAPWREATHHADQWTPAAIAAARSDLGRVFLGFSRFPATRSQLNDV